MSKTLIVQKFGGATLASPEKVIEIARRITDLKKQGQQIVAIVSAMGQTTDQLLSMAHQVAKQPTRRELDMLLTAGERISMSLLSMALQSLGCDSISFTGSQAGILTDDSHVNAHILDVKAFRVQAALNQNKVVVLAGFQGVSPISKEITTLGRGGTDTTAVAMAVFLKASRCEILKDVPSVYSADPRLVPHAIPLNQLTYSQMLDMTFWGAKVMHYRSVELAAVHEIPLYVGPAHASDKTGTWISGSADSEKSQDKKINLTGESRMFETPRLISVNSHQEVLCVQTKSSTQENILRDFSEALSRAEIAFPQILHLRHINQPSGISQFDLLVTGPKEILHSISQNFKNSSQWMIAPQNLCSVTATCVGSSSSEISQKLFSQLSNHNIEIHHALFAPLSLSFIIDQKDHQKAVRCLHELVPC